MLDFTITAQPGMKRYVARARAMLRFLDELIKEPSTVEVHLVDDMVMRKNVLAYEAPRYFPRPDIAGKPLGEIYLNPQYIVEHGEDFDLMLVHGFLHLLGYDHKARRDRIKMEERENALLKKFSKQCGSSICAPPQ